MKERRFEKAAIVVNVLNDVEKDDYIVGFAELSGTSVDVVANTAAFAAASISQRRFVEIESIELRTEMILELALHKSIAAADFREPEIRPVELRSQPP